MDESFFLKMAALMATISAAFFYGITQIKNSDWQFALWAGFVAPGFLAILFMVMGLPKTGKRPAKQAPTS